MQQTGETVFVGLSGGVDSSVTATRLLADGHHVVGVFIKTWQPDFIHCNWEAERLDAMRVAAQLGIPFLTCDAVESYKKDVADYMIREYTVGRTPNPDVMCNRYVKFGTFLEFARAHGAQKIATGHYAQVRKEDDGYTLYRGVDIDKDQSYFLWTLTQEQLAQTYFPVGNTTKQRIRKEAERHALPTHAKQDSQGICFLGQIDITEFLSHYVSVEDGDVLDESGKVIGTHTGALFYTIGQRQGFSVTTRERDSLPHYVIGKDMSSNTITVSTKHPEVGKRQVVLSDLNFIGGSCADISEAQFRYRQKPFHVQVEALEGGRAMLTVLDEHVDMPGTGQSCVFYRKDQCLGGGIIENIL